MAIQDAEALPPRRESWWRNYLLGYVAACGVGPDRAELLATEMAQQIRGHAWVHVGLGAMDGLRAVAALGRPMGVVSNSDGSVRATCAAWASATSRPPPTGGIRRPGSPWASSSTPPWSAWPNPTRLSSASRSMPWGVPADRSVLHVGDSLRYDVAGAAAAGLQPVHMDPYGFCPAPGGHPHIRGLAELASPPISTPR